MIQKCSAETIILYTYWSHTIIPEIVALILISS